VVWCIPLFLTAHNVEEALAFQRMWARLPGLLPEPFATFEARLSVPLMLQVLAGLSLLAFLLAAVVVARPKNRTALWLLLAVEAAVVINVVAHVLSAALVFRGYGPGLATAVLLNAPFAWYALRRARAEAWVSRRAWNALAIAGAVLHGPVLVGALWLVGSLGG
jgi:hypothetical protein